MNRVVVYTNCDDWEGLFVNGVLESQGHKIEIRDLSTLCPIESLEREEMESAVNDYLAVCGQFDEGITLEEARGLLYDWGDLPDGDA